MEIKLLEIRDRGTFIPAMAVRVSGEDGYLLRRAGFGSQPLVLLIHLEMMKCSYDPYDWPRPSRTMTDAHLWITKHWEEFETGQVVDVEFVLGYTKEPKRSEAEG